MQLTTGEKDAKDGNVAAFDNCLPYQTLGIKHGNQKSISQTVLRCHQQKTKAKVHNLARILAHAFAQHAQPERRREAQIGKARSKMPESCNCEQQRLLGARKLGSADFVHFSTIRGVLTKPKLNLVVLLEGKPLG